MSPFNHVFDMNGMQVAKLFDTLDLDRDGSISWEEFSSFLQRNPEYLAVIMAARPKLLLKEADRIWGCHVTYSQESGESGVQSFKLSNLPMYFMYSFSDCSWHHKEVVDKEVVELSVTTWLMLLYSTLLGSTKSLQPGFHFHYELAPCGGRSFWRFLKSCM